MAIAKGIQKSLEGSSLIRKMFEEGARRKQEFGADQVFDFSLGNPVFEPPKQVIDSLVAVLQSDTPGLHRYMPNAGLPETRAYIADKLSGLSGLAVEPQDVVMCVGAGGALNVILRSILDPGDEVIVLAPYFVEYDFYIQNFGGSPVVVQTSADFTPDLDAIAASITSRTKAMLINSPNNPTGVVYTQEQLAGLSQLLLEKSKDYGEPISLISDEPYRGIIFDDIVVPSVMALYPHTIVATSASKELALPGERIGYLGISPRHQDRDLLSQAAALALRTLGFVNAPALMQRMLPMVDGVQVDTAAYEINRNLLYDHLIKLGFECVRPHGAFYLFPKCPNNDEAEFIRQAQELNLLVVPGSAFGKPGFFRLAYCFETEMIERSLPVFTELMRRVMPN